MKSMRFQKLALDADLLVCCTHGVDRAPPHSQASTLSSVAVDLVFKRICGPIDSMDFGQFLDGMVQLALLRYPDEPDSTSALVRLFRDKLSTFTSPPHADDQDEQVPEDFLDIVRSCHPNVVGLYKSYFAYEVNLKFQLKDSLPQKALLELLADYDVCPTLVPRAVVQQGYRELMGAASLPLIDETVLPLLGRHFTYHHFLLMLLWLSRRAFPRDTEPDSVKILALFTHMDSSKGGVIARMKSATIGLIPHRIVTKEIRSMLKSERDANRLPPMRPMSRKPSISNDDLNLVRDLYKLYSHNGQLSLEAFSKFCVDIGHGCDSVARFNDATGATGAMGFVAFTKTVESMGCNIGEAYDKATSVVKPGPMLDIGSAVVNEPELTQAIATADKGIETMFKKYTWADGIRIDNFAKFLSDYGLDAMMPSDSALDVFKQCKGHGDVMKLEGFRLAFVAIANRTMPGDLMADRLVRLFHRLNRTASGPPVFAVSHART